MINLKGKCPLCTGRSLGSWRISVLVCEKDCSERSKHISLKTTTVKIHPSIFLTAYKNLRSQSCWSLYQPSSGDKRKTRSTGCWSVTGLKHHRFSHSHLWPNKNYQLTQHACFWTVGGSQHTQRRCKLAGRFESS